MCILLNHQDVERALWARIAPGCWRPLHEDLERGFSVEWHDLKASESVNWGQSLQPDTLKICFNFEGSAQLSQSFGRLAIERTSLAYFRVYKNHKATRLAAQRHKFLTVTLSLSFARTHLEDQRAALSPGLADLIFRDEQPPQVHAPVALSARPMRQVEQDLAKALLKPSVESPALPIYYRAKVLEVLSVLFFSLQDQESEFFCFKQKRVASDRVQKACAHIAANLEHPLTLEQLGRQIGCSSYYLSRLFSETMGMTISRYARQLRIEQAAKLLASGRFNVSEAAIEVGYQSLSHFSKAFKEVKGCNPSDFNV